MNEFMGLLIWLAERLTPVVIDVVELLLGDTEDEVDDNDEDDVVDDADDDVVAVVADEALVSVLHESGLLEDDRVE